MNTTATDCIFDEKKAQAFAEHMVGNLNAAAVTLMTSLGHRTGLFDTLAQYSPVTATGLADRTGLAARYVREWLAVMVTGRVVDYDPENALYSLPAEHAACLTRTASPDNIAVTAQFIPVMAAVEEQMYACFHSGQGLKYSHFQRFHEVMAEDSAQLVGAALFEHILPLVDGLPERLARGVQVADVACGAGRALLAMAEAYPQSQFLGVDLCADAFAETQVAAARRGLGNLSFKALDLAEVDALGEFDLITGFDAVHDQKDPLAMLKMIGRSLAPDGVFLMQDIGGSQRLENNLDYPFAPLLYTISLMHCTPVSIGQGGEGLGTMWGVETAQDFLAQAGFSRVQTHRLPHDAMNAYFVAQR